MSDVVVLTAAERALFRALDELDVRFLVIGLSAALLEGAPIVTQDIDVWFGDNPPWNRLQEAARRAGGFYTSGMGLHRPMIGGRGLERIDLVLSAHGLDAFDAEFARSRSYDVDGTLVRVLPLERVLASKRAAGRAKDIAVIVALEDAIAARRARNGSA